MLIVFPIPDKLVSILIGRTEVMASSKFDYSYITEPDAILKCSICLGIDKDQPMQHGGSGCGKLFCKKCIKKYGKKKPCPMCRGERPRYFEDVRSKFKLSCK